MLPRTVRQIVIPPEIRRSIERHVADDHPNEAGGFLACERRGTQLYATRQIPVLNGSSRPKYRFETVVDERVPPPPRVFYHSHTSARSPAGLTKVDERSIPEPFALVVFAPHGPALSYRAFKRGLLRWRELRVETVDHGL
ncbi:hypothetical protein [Natrinema versiforme]|uniref:hypothetical protein n=1 Tax=Natrinema versiforme TaxID=88724 RepID=UPI00195532FB|nr:hypothetical protein [Natrinema versiforme]